MTDTGQRYLASVRRPATPVALAWAAALAGLISIVSALTPELANRLDLVQAVLPPGIPEAARTVALALGLGMVFLSRGLARRKRRAWSLAVALVIASAVAHLAKGLDVEEAAFHVALLVALLRSRRHFARNHPNARDGRRTAIAHRTNGRHICLTAVVCSWSW